MEEIFSYLIPVLAITALTAGWMAVQMLAKSMKVKNHIDRTSGCCGACDNKDTCDGND
jgi:hypothetical protein